MKPCYLCNESGDKRVPLLVCRCYVCCRCYCTLKSQGLTQCLKCTKILMRGGKKNL